MQLQNITTSEWVREREKPVDCSHLCCSNIIKDYFYMFMCNKTTKAFMFLMFIMAQAKNMHSAEKSEWQTLYKK